jgi:hypothetical protein
MLQVVSNCKHMHLRKCRLILSKKFAASVSEWTVVSTVAIPNIYELFVRRYFQFSQVR